MTNPDEHDEALSRLAEAISDHHPVNWAAATPSGAPHDPALERLQMIEAIAAAHRAGRAAAESEAHATPAAGAGSWGPFRLIERLSSGSFGEVYRAFDPELQREVAIKRRRPTSPDDTHARRWIEEARRLARIRHPHVLTVYGVGFHDGRAGIWTELLRGSTLEQRLEAHGRLGAREAALIGIDLCAALAAVHAAGLVHGDVTTANVMREGGPSQDLESSDSGRTVLVDFGSVTEQAPAGSHAGVALVVTPVAAAPEVLRGGSPSRASDLYALGVLLYRLVTGRYPIDAANMETLLDRVARGERTPLRTARPDLPAPFVAVVERAMADSPDARYADAGEMERALAATLGGSGSIAATPGAPARPAATSPTQRALRGLRWALTAAVALAILVVAIMRITERRTAAPAPSTAREPARALPQLAPGTAPGTSAGAQQGTAGSAATDDAAAQAAEFTGVHASFFRAGSNDPLVDGGAIQPGDLMHLEIETPEAAHVYVLDEDEQGRVYVLFPVAGVDLHNPLPAHTRIRLPGRLEGKRFDWQVTSSGGEEHLLALASRRPLPEVDEQVASIEHATPGREVTYAEMPLAALETPRGIGGMAESEPAPDRASRLTALAKRLAGRHPHDVWMRTLWLRNP